MKHEIIMLATSFAIVFAIVLPIVLLCGKFRSPSPSSTTGYRWATADVILLVVMMLFVDSLCLSLMVQSPLSDLLLPADVVMDLKMPINETAALTGGVPVAAKRVKYDAALPVAGLWARLFASVTVMSMIAIRLIVQGISIAPPFNARTLFQSGMTWIVVAPIVLSINIISAYLITKFDTVADVHPLAKIGGDPWLMPLFIVSACLATPIFEEWLFRGILLPWASGHLNRSLVLFLPAGLFAWFGAKTHQIGVLAFFGVIVIGFWVILHFDRRLKIDVPSIAAIYSTSALFAAMHASVWPSPIPLFVFSLALGWLAQRTNGITAPVIVHGLLNAVSTLYVLRGGPMP